MKMLCKVQLSKHRYKTPEGYLVCKDCVIARTGKQTYLESELYGVTEGEDKYIDVDRKPEQVFDEKTMASFEGKPLTIEHPDVSVSPENYKDLAVGNVHNVRKGKFEGQDVMLADINVYDAEAIGLIESGEMEELSCGYDCDITDGPNPEQINIRGNHVALCEQGRAGIARIQDSIPNKDLKEIDGSINYHYRTDMANELDMAKFADRMIWEYLPNELSRQLTKEEKEYVKQEAKKIMSDSWGVKPVVKDGPLAKDLSGIPTVELSFRMPEEAGRDKRLHYMPGIRNCVALAEELDKKASSLGVSKMKTKTTKAPFSEGDRQDSWWEMSKKHGWYISREWDSSAKSGEFNEYYVFTKIGDKAKVGDSVQKGTLIQEFGRYGGQYKVSKIQGNVLYCEDVDTGKTFLFKKDKENVDWAVITKGEIHDALPSKEEWELMQMGDLTDNKYDITLQHAVEDLRKYPGDSLLGDERAIRMLMHRFGLDKRSVIRYLNYAFDGKVTPKDAVSKNKDLLGSKKKHWTIDLDHDTLVFSGRDLSNFGGGYHEHRFSDNVYDNLEEAVADAKKLFEEYKDQKEITDNKYGYYSVKILEWQNGGGFYVDEEGNKIGVSPAFSAYDKNEIQGALREEMKRLGYIKDSFVPLYAIALGENTWLDDNDRPTDSVEKARKFSSAKEADDYRKIYCKGEVKKLSPGMHDSYSPSGEIEELKKLLSGISYKSIDSDDELKVIDILFEDRKEQRKAARKLISLYDIELSEEGDEDFWITIYDKYDEPRGIRLNEDSAPVRCNMRKGKPAEDLKAFLKEKSLSFKDSDVGEFIHFEIEKADESVKKEIVSINDHYSKVGVYDDYSKRFYIKAIKALEEKLGKLERNELLDSNQQEYQSQKERLMKEIKDQIEEYKKKLNAF